jgi:hypothetical protein
LSVLRFMASEYLYGIIKLFLCFLCGTNNGFWYTANKASYLYLRRIRKKVGKIIELKIDVISHWACHNQRGSSPPNVVWYTTIGWRQEIGGLNGAINRRTDNTMTERKKDKRANNDLQYTTGTRGTELPPPF